jgi:Na+/pantothenate symporter
VNTDLLVAFGALTVVFIILVLYGLYDERKSKKKADAAAREKP